MVLFPSEKNAVYIGQLPVERDDEHGVLSSGRRNIVCARFINPSREECVTERDAAIVPWKIICQN
jgi:hypothetical protein